MTAFIVIALQKYHKKSWKPFLISLSMEVSSLVISLLHRRQKLTKLENEELTKRFNMLWFYLLRNPLYDRFTKDKINKLCISASKKPIIFLFSNLILDYMPLWENYHFITN